MMQLQKSFNVLIIIYMVLWLFSCDNPNAPDCFQEAGDLKTITIHDYPTFEKLVINDNFNLIISEDDTTYFELSFYENLIPEISYSIDQNSLVFSNNNSCNFVRDYKSPTLVYHSSKISNRILAMSTGEITNTDTLRQEISITTTDVSNLVNLVTNNNNTFLASNSSTNFKLRGKTKNLKIAAYFNDGIFDCRQLNCQRAIILQRGYNDIIVNVSDSLVGSIENAGKVIYYGSPGIKMNIFGGGELIKAIQ